MKKIFICIFSILAISTFSDSLLDSISVPDACLELSVNPAKIYASQLYKECSSVIQITKNKEYLKFLNAIKGYGYKETDIAQICFSFGIKKESYTMPLDKLCDNAYSYISAIKLAKTIDTDKLREIINTQISGRADCTLKLIKHNNADVICLRAKDKENYFCVAKNANVVLCGDYSSVVGYIDGKRYSRISLPDVLSKNATFKDSDDTIYIACLVPEPISNSIAKTKTSPASPENNSVKNIDTNAFKDFKAMVIKFKVKDTLNIEVYSYFNDVRSTESINKMVGIFLPLLKFQIMLQTNGQPLPFIDNFNGEKIGKNIVFLHANLSAQDIKTLTNIKKRPSQPDKNNL